MRYPTLLAFLVTLLFAAPLAAHEGHQENMSDAEMVAMEAGAAVPAASHGDGMVQAHGSGGSADTASPTTSTLSPEQIMQQKFEENRLTSTSDLLGRLHPIAVHFPIALLVIAALAELALMIRPSLGIETTVRFLVAGGALGAVTAAALGWFAGGWRLLDRSENLAIHRWNGTTIAAVSLLAWWFATPGKKRLGLRLLLALIVVALVIQGYLGGEMMSGPNHLGIF